MTTLSAGYFDAAGKNNGSGVLVVAGIVAPVKKWVRFDRKWKEVLDSENIQCFHMTDFASSRGEFEPWNGDRERRGLFWSRLLKVITDTANKMFWVAIELDAWRSVNRDYQLEETFHTPYSMCGFTAVIASLKWARKRKKIPIEFFFEDGDDGREGLRKLCAREDIGPIFGSKRLQPLQAADLLAWKARTLANNAFRLHKKIEDSSEPDFESFGKLLKELESFEKVKVRPHVDGIYSREKLISTCIKSRVQRRLIA